MVSATSKLPVPGWPNILIMSLGHFTSDFFTNFLPVLLPLFALQFDISYSQSALIFTIFSVISYILQPAIGIMADRMRITLILPHTIALAALLVCTVSYVDSYAVLLVVLTLSGLCSSFFHPLSAGLLPVIMPAQKGLATSIYIAGGNIGGAMGPIIVAALVSAFSADYLIVLALPAFVVSLLMLKRNLHQRKIAPPTNDASAALPFRKLAFSKDYVLLNLSICLRSWPHCALLTFIPLLYASLNYSSAQGAWALVIYMLGSVVGGLIAGSFADKCPLRRILICSYCIILLSGFAYFQQPGMSFLSLTLLFIAGGAMYAAIPVGVIWGQRLMPQYASFASSMSLGFSFAVGFIFTPITGVIADHGNLTQALLYTLVPLVVLSLMVILFVHEPKNPNLQASAR